MFQKIFIFFLGFQLLGWVSKATIITSQAPGGNWNSTSTWVGGQIPGNDDTVRIAGGSQIRVTNPVTIKRIVFLTDTASSRVDLASGISFSVTETLRFDIPTRDNRNFIFDVDSGQATFNRVEYNNPTGDSRRSIIRINTGWMIVVNVFDMGTTSSSVRRRVEIVGPGKAIFQGLVLNTSFMSTSPGSHVAFNGAGSFNLFTTDYHKLTISGPGTKNLGTSTVSGALEIENNGILNQTGELTLLDSVVLSGAQIRLNNNNLVLAGNFQIVGFLGSFNYFNQNGSGTLRVVGDNPSRFTQTFPIGVNGDYTPVTINKLASNFPGTTGSRWIEIKSFSGRHPFVTGTDNAAKRWFRIRTNNITVVTKFGVDFQYADADVAAPIVENSLNTTALLRSNGWQTNFAGSSLDYTVNWLKVDSTNTLIDGDYTFGQNSAFPASFPFVYSVRNGQWGTASNWSSNAVPNASTDVRVLHNITEMGGGCRDLTVEISGSCQSSSGSSTINGKLEVFGAFGDSHSGGTNTIFGKVLVHPTGNFFGTGSGSGTSFVFANDIENNGNWNVNTNRIEFSRQVKTKIEISGNPLVFTRSQGNLLIKVDSLVLRTSSSPTNANEWDATITVGDTNFNFNCALFNMSRLIINNLTSRQTTGFVRKFVQENGAYLGFKSSTPFSGTTGILEATAQNNTVDYLQGGSQTIKAIDYFNLHVNGDRFDRFKTLESGPNVTLFGNLVVNNDGAVFQFSPTANNQRLTVKGNIELNGNARLRSSPSGNNRTFLELEGRFINNSTQSFGVDLSPSDTNYTDLVLKGTGNKCDGAGNFNLGNVTLSSADTLRWLGFGRMEVDSSFTNNAQAFIMRNGTFYIPQDARFSFLGTSNHTRLEKFLVADRADRRVFINQRINLEIDSSFSFLPDGRTSLGSYYDFSGKSLVVKGRFLVGFNGGQSGMRADSLATFVLEGNLPASGIGFASGFRKLRNFVHNKSANPAVFSQPMTIYSQLDLFRGALTGASNIRMWPGASVRRSNGSITTTLSNTSGKYNVEYWGNLTTGPEAISLASIAKMTITAGATDTVKIGNSPTLDSNLVYISGRMANTGTNFVRLGSNSYVEVSAPVNQVVFPVATLTTPSPIALNLTSIGSGRMLLKPFRALAPNIPADANITLNRYVEVSGNATFPSYGLGFSYADADVNGGQDTSLRAQFYNGSSWQSDFGTVDAGLNLVGMNTLTGTGILTAFRVVVSNRTTENSLVQILPNPTYGKIRIKSPESIRFNALRDVLGKEMEVSVYQTNDGLQLDLSPLPEGLYFLQLQAGEKSEIHRIIKLGN
jgi:hypothetical protein